MLKNKEPSAGNCKEVAAKFEQRLKEAEEGRDRASAIALQAQTRNEQMTQLLAEAQGIKR